MMFSGLAFRPKPLLGKRGPSPSPPRNGVGHLPKKPKVYTVPKAQKRSAVKSRAVKAILQNWKLDDVKMILPANIMPRVLWESAPDSHAMLDEVDREPMSPYHWSKRLLANLRKLSARDADVAACQSRLGAIVARRQELWGCDGGHEIEGVRELLPRDVVELLNVLVPPSSGMHSRPDGWVAGENDKPEEDGDMAGNDDEDEEVPQMV
ncbi:hypothetical protein P280DRAFT_268976 [Massarina eburnea CBS 473.64]|uniref:Uncharacterized protein n=1 Tax=Massarina eburnea CBS 473.64 TaxID=1395130 RepID=A0A6A6S8R3_9PLEO|nr:hypothetical protein P280DRAFT_268976 [Massarina eburnea CBS 473.64]